MLLDPKQQVANTIPRKSKDKISRGKAERDGNTEY
jgi:hypothetical protein